MIYLDYAATTPISEESLQTYIDTSRYVFGNSQSLHDVGSIAANLLDTCRQKLATYLHGEKEGVIFTSGGTEANILAIETLLGSNKEKGNHIITTAIEHASIKNYLCKLEKEGYQVTFLPVDSDGRVSLHHIEDAITENTVLASIQYVNSEIGTIQQIKEIGSLLKKRNVLFHTDCVQGFGKIPIDIREFHIDSLSVSSHKIYGPKGIGLCYINPAINRIPVIEGTTHEFGFRGGTVNLPGIAAFTTASEQRMNVMKEEYHHILQLKKYFLEHLKPFIHLEGSINHSLPHILGVTIPNIEGQHTLLTCNRNDIMISTGSACSVELQAPSHVLLAVGKDSSEAKTFVRFSFGKDTTKEQLTKTIDVIKRMIETY